MHTAGTEGGIVVGISLLISIMIDQEAKFSPMVVATAFVLENFKKIALSSAQF